MNELRDKIRAAIAARCPAADFIEGEILLIECLACPQSRFDPFALEIEPGLDPVDGTFLWMDQWIERHARCKKPRQV